jgi:hypothetical protein
VTVLVGNNALHDKSAKLALWTVNRLLRRKSPSKISTEAEGLIYGVA